MAFSSLFRKKTVQDILKQIENEADGHEGRHLTARDLTALVLCHSGCWYFSTIGKASSDGGPAVIFLFYLRRLPVVLLPLLMPSLRQWFPFPKCIYTYSCCLWGTDLVGWALIMEYAIGNITVAISWSDYFTGLLESGGIHLPQWVQMDYLTASTGYRDAMFLDAGLV
jgi:hypothetical protein